MEFIFCQVITMDYKGEIQLVPVPTASHASISHGCVIYLFITGLGLYFMVNLWL